MIVTSKENTIIIPCGCCIQCLVELSSKCHYCPLGSLGVTGTQTLNKNTANHIFPHIIKVYKCTSKIQFIKILILYHCSHPTIQDHDSISKLSC